MVSRDEAYEIVSTVLSEDISQLSSIRDGVNTVYQITTPSDSYILKLGTANRTGVKREISIYSALEQTALELPQIHDKGTYNEIPYFISTCITGQQLLYSHQLSEKTILRAGYHLGQILGEIHTVNVPCGDLYGSKDGLQSETGMPWPAYFEWKLDSMAADATKNYPALADQAKRLSHQSKISSTENTVLVPVDLHTHNIFWEDESVAGVIDFERAYGGTKGWGFAVVRRMLTLKRNDTMSQKIMTRFQNGYQEYTPIPTITPHEELAAIIREMRAAHIWWENPESRTDQLQQEINTIQHQIQ